MNHQEQIILQVSLSFPQAQVKTISKFSGGLVSKAYRVEINNPSKVLVIKFFPTQKGDNVIKSMKISNYLVEKGLPAPRFYSVTPGKLEGVAIMDCAIGQSVNDVWESVSANEKKVILQNTGSLLNKIHRLPIPEFWTHKKHEIKSSEEWKAWTKLRTEKYLVFAREYLSDHISSFLEEKFSRLLALYEMYSNFDLGPLHWDYHFGNINVDEKQNVTGVFDFDNTMKGHNMADIGQSMYWLVRMPKFDRTLLGHFFAGYGGLNDIDREFIYLHFILFLSATTRSVWPKENLKWLTDYHVGLLEACQRGEYIITE
jgi:aminoglycoside phosphotransferase (APT) family kinase protein